MKDLKEKKLPRVVIIGAGLGGLSAAIRLASRGYAVTLFEQNSQLGGKMNMINDNGYVFDTGPSLLTMPFVIDELFGVADVRRSDYLEFIPIAPVCRYFWENGTTIDTFTNSDAMVQQLGKLSRQDAENYSKFLNYSERIYDLTANIFLFNPIHELDRILNWKTFKTLFRIFQIDPMRTVHQGVSRFFQHPKIVQLFDRYATYNGSNPYQAPATLNIIPYVEYGLGSYYIQGGMYQLIVALEQVARQVGVEIYPKTRVEKINVYNGQVQGVSINGANIKADVIIANVDVVTAFDQLITGFDNRTAQLKKFEPSLSGLVFLWGVKKQNPQLAHHNIFFPEDYLQEFVSIFDQKQVPRQPTIYLAITSKTDQSHAPAGSENWFVLLNMPYLMEGQNWEMITHEMRQYVFKKLEKLDINISGSIEYEKVLTPQDLFDYYGSNRGSIYGISSNSRTTAFRRPPNRNREIKGLYFAGGSTHPGGGVPLVVLSGKMCAELILQRENG